MPPIREDAVPEYDPFLCKCKRCSQFWQRSFSEVSLIRKPSIERAANTSTILTAIRNRENHPAILKLGDRVVIKDKYRGYIKWVGILKQNVAAPETVIGVKLDDSIAAGHDGVYKGKRYFYCQPGHGMMAKYCDIIRVNPPETKPPLTGNEMYPSFKDVQARRKAHLEKDTSWYLKAETSQVRISADKYDVAAMDLRKKQRRDQKARRLAEQEKVAREQQFVKDTEHKWKERFGGDARAERLANTLKKLHIAYVDGEDYKRREDEGDLTDYSDDEIFGKRETMDKSRERLKWRSSMKARQRKEQRAMVRH